MSRFMVVSRKNKLLAADIGPDVARLVAASRPGWGVVGRDENLARTLSQESEVFGVHAKSVVIPPKASKRKPVAETVMTTSGIAEILERYDDGTIKIRLKDGRLFRIQEAPCS